MKTLKRLALALILPSVAFAQSTKYRLDDNDVAEQDFWDNHLTELKLTLDDEIEPAWANLAGIPSPTLTIIGSGSGSVTFDLLSSGTLTLTVTPASIGAATAAQGEKADGAVQADSGTASNLTLSGTSSDVDGNTLAIWGIRQFYSAEEELQVDFDFGRLYAGNVLSVDWESRTLHGAWSATNMTLSGTINLDGTFSGTGVIPGANVQASGTGNAGVSYFATDAEIQTGTDQAKSVRPSGLAAWWTWLKTQAQTVVGNWTFSGTTTANVVSATTATVTSGTVGTLNVTGNATLSGQTTLPNQVASSSAAAMTRGLGDTRYWDTLAPTVHDVSWVSARTTVSGGGGAASAIDQFRWGWMSYSGTESGGKARAVHASWPIEQPNSGIGVNYARPLTIYSTVWLVRLGSDSQAQLVYGLDPTSNASPATGAAKGFGVRTTGAANQIVCFVSNGTSGAGSLTESSPQTITIEKITRWKIASNNGTVAFSYRYLDTAGAEWTQVYTTTLGPTGYSVGAYATALATLALNSGTTTGSQAWFQGGKIIYQNP